MTRATTRSLPASRTVAGVLARLDTDRLRAALVVAIITAAVLTPSISLHPSLPDMRAEQVLALPAMLLIPHAARGRRRWLEPVGIAFAGLGLATLVSIVFAPLVLGEAASPRDGYELVKLALYGVLFRFGVEAAQQPRVRQVALMALFAAGTLAASVALGQYFDAPGVRRLAEVWAPAHHLLALERDARAFGTLPNPNYFGALMALVAVLGLCASTPREAAARALRVLAASGIATGVLGVVLSGSRGALGLLVIGSAVACGVLWLRARRLPLLGAALATMTFIASVGLVEALPRGRQDYLTRVVGVFDPARDNSLRLRWERWGAALGHEGWSSLPAPSFLPRPTGKPAASLEAQGRDARRKQDVFAISERVEAYRRRTGGYPAGPSLDATLGETLPVDPLHGSPYRYERTATGYTIASQLEDPADPYFPVFALGEVRNYLRNAGAEEPDGNGAAFFRSLPGTSYRRGEEAAFIGLAGIVFAGNPSNPTKRAAIFQQRYLGRHGGVPFTASVWVKLPATIQGEVFLYVNVLYTDGTRQDPFAKVAADSTQIGVWQRLVLTFTPEASRRIDFIGVYLLADAFVGEAYADGFELVDGSVPVRFTGLPEAPDASLGRDAGAQFRRSPIFGVGPQKADGAGTVDNEYLLVLARYGLVGLAAYLALWLAVFVVAVRRAGRDALGVAAGLAGAVVGVLAFNVVAGSLYQLQLMGVFWPVAGVILAGERDA